MIRRPTSSSLQPVPPALKRVSAIFYRTEAGNEPLRDWLRDLDRDDRRRIGGDVKLAEYAWPIGMPTCRAMGEGLREIRTDLGGGRTARVLFYIDRHRRMVLLHGFIKKSRATPGEDLDLARANKRRHEKGLA